MSRRHKILLSLGLLSLLAGIINYILFRPGIILLKLLDLNLTPLYIKNILLKKFMIGSFSDIAWCLSLCCITRLLFELNNISFMGMILLFTLPFITELLQYFQLIHGTFDWFDLLTYAIIIIISIIFFINIKTSENEKT